MGLGRCPLKIAEIDSQREEGERASEQDGGEERELIHFGEDAREVLSCFGGE